MGILRPTVEPDTCHRNLRRWSANRPQSSLQRGPRPPRRPQKLRQECPERPNADNKSFKAPAMTRSSLLQELFSPEAAPIKATPPRAASAPTRSSIQGADPGDRQTGAEEQRDARTENRR